MRCRLSRLIGIDPGIYTTGIAVAEAPNLIPRPLGSLGHSRSGVLLDIQENARIIDFGLKYKPDILVCGAASSIIPRYPILKWLTNIWSIPKTSIYYVDKSFTSVLCEAIESSNRIHELSACAILSIFQKRFTE